MKFRLILLLSLLMNISFGQTKTSFSIYNNKLFAINYPSTWDTANKDSRLIFNAVEKRKNDKDIFKENFGLYTVNLDKAMTLQSLVESTVAAFKQQGNSDKDIIEKAVKKSKKGISYGLFKSKQLAKELTIIASSVCFLKDKKVFILTLSYDNKDMTTYEKIYNDVINSFEFK